MAPNLFVFEAAGGAGPQEVRQAAQEATEGSGRMYWSQCQTARCRVLNTGIAVDDTNQLLAQVAV